MKLLAGSLDVEPGTFLHAGYLSASPRSFGLVGRHSLDGETKLIDITKSLELKDAQNQAVSMATANLSDERQPLPLGSMISEGLPLAFAFFFFVWLISFYYRRVRKVTRPGWRPWILTGTPLLALLFVFYWIVPDIRVHQLNSLAPPWQGVPVQEYEYPEMATHAILQGLLVNALAGSPLGIIRLAAIQGEVAFPIPSEEYSPGMIYAQKTYGRDGWGREFAFEPLSGGKYRIASMGPDGAFDTHDDIVVVIESRNRSWESCINGIYVRPVAGKKACFVHRVDDSMFRAANAAEARGLTANDLFDVFPLDGLASSNDKLSPILAKLNQQDRPEPGGMGTPLIFVQFTGKRYD